MPRVLCAGHVNWDVTLHVDRLPGPDGEARIVDQRQGGGGSASNAAAVLAQLGVDATLLGSVGDDEYGLLARYELADLGVVTDLVVVDGASTSVKYLVVDEAGEVMVLGNEGTNEAFGPADVDAGQVERADTVLLTSQRPATAERVLDLANAADVPVSVAPGRRIADCDHDEVVERASTVFVNEHEVDGLCADPAEMAHEREQTIVVTHGDTGATAYTPDGSHTHPGYDVDPVDTTGAGDAFAAGFLAARFDRSPADALAVANACGAVASRTTGARTRLDWDDLDPFLD